MEEITKAEKAPKATFLSKADCKLAWPHWIRNSLLGTFIGMLPGAGSTIAAFVGYGTSKSFSKVKEEFGHGTVEGVIGPETANNASVGGAFVPLLTMGIPGSASTALILNVFLIHGLQPGPLLFTNQPDLVYPIFMSMLIVNCMILIVPMFMTKHIVKVLKVPYKYMGAAIIFVALVGAYVINNRISDVWITLIFGLLGYAMVRFQYSPSAVALGLVLGPILEKNMRQTLQLYRGDYMQFFDHPIALVMTVVALFMIFLPLGKAAIHMLRKNSAT